MGILGAYRGIKNYFAVLVAAFFSAALATGIALVTCFALGFIPGKIDRFDGLPGGEIAGGLLLALISVNIAIVVFIAGFTFLVNLHHPTSWRTPTFAFTLCVGLVRFAGPFDIQFTPFMLGTGAVAWLVSCGLLHRRSLTTKHVIQA